MTRSRGIGRDWAKGRVAADDPRIAKRAWSKGLTAATDARVARAAAAHRGMTYQRRTPIEECRWSGGRRRTVAPEWSAEMAYAVGLIATDGCLLRTRKQIGFVSRDRELVETFLRCLGSEPILRTDRTRLGNPVFRVQFGDAVLYRWLIAVGLTPRKSLTLGGIDVPGEFLLPLVRGLLDGDGTILNKVYRADTRDRQDYWWELLQTKFVSGSRPHLEWLRGRLKETLAVDGYLQTRSPDPPRHPVSELRYGKRDSLVLLRRLYADPFAPRLERKWRIWNDYSRRHPPA
ncbi:MAG: hypothetical protein ACRDF0_02765 [Candidatus Limnocylindria bacterium]